MFINIIHSSRHISRFRRESWASLYVATLSISFWDRKEGYSPSNVLLVCHIITYKGSQCLCLVLLDTDIVRCNSLSCIWEPRHQAVSHPGCFSFAALMQAENDCFTNRSTWNAKRKDKTQRFPNLPSYSLWLYFKILLMTTTDNIGDKSKTLWSLTFTRNKLDFVLRMTQSQLLGLMALKSNLWIHNSHSNTMTNIEGDSYKAFPDPKIPTKLPLLPYKIL